MPENEYKPDSVAPPWEHIVEAVVAKMMEEGDLGLLELVAEWLADEAGLLPGLDNDVEIHAEWWRMFARGKRTMTADVADGLETALGPPSSFWLKLQADYEWSLANRSGIKNDRTQSEDVSADTRKV